MTTLRTQVRDLPRVSIFSQFQYLSFKDKTSDRNISTGLTALRNPSLFASWCLCVCVCVCVCVSVCVCECVHELGEPATEKT